MGFPFAKEGSICQFHWGCEPRLPHGDFYEVYCKCDLETCEERDPKGLYARARKGEIDNFTGISAPYEEPIKPDIVINTSVLTIDKEVNLIIEKLKAKRLIASQ